MFLKQVELKGFKSFADRTVIDFEEGITCIVGPNGSGKSNITDAFRWVLGEQRYKTLRGTQMLDVIFNGTHHRKPLGFAEVSITFDNQTNFLPIEYNEVIVTRRLHRSGESEYAINDVACRLKDIKQLFMDTGVGVEGYSIIGQGRIDSILSTNKDERRLIFEEAAGIVKYRTRKTEAERKLTRTKDNLDRINDIVSELEQRVGPLKLQAEKAKIYKQLAEELKDLEINLFVHDIEKANSSLKIIEDDLIAKKDANDKLRQQLNSAQTAHSKMADELSYLEIAHEKDLHTQSDQQQQIVKLEGDTALLCERKRTIAERITQMGEDERTSKLAIEKINTAIASLKLTIDEQLKKMQTIDQAVQDTQRQLSQIDQQADQQSVQIADLQGQIDQKNAQIQQATQDNHRLMVSDELSADRLKTMKSENDHFISLQAKIATREKEQKQALNSIKAQLEQLEGKRQSKSQSVKSLQSDMVKAENDIYQLKAQIAESSSKHDALVQQEENQEGFSYAVRQVLKWAQDDCAVYGSMKDLFSIDAKFDTAIETALGRNLQTIIVQSDDVVDDYIDRLKSEKAGRATFIPVSQIEPRALPKIKASAGFYGCAMNYVNCKPHLTPAYQYMLSNVFFADSLSDAKRAARKLTKGSRIVTLEGEVVNAGGTLTGGSLSKRETGFLQRKRSIEALEKSLAKNRQAVSKIESERDDNLKRIIELREQLTRVESQIEDAKDQLLSLQRDWDQTCAEQTRNAQSQSQIDAEVAQLNSASAARAVSLNDNNQIIAANKSQLDQLNQAVIEYQAQLDQCLNRRQSLAEQLTEARITSASAAAEHQALVERANDLERQSEQLLNSRQLKANEYNQYQKQQLEIADLLKANDETIEMTKRQLTMLSAAIQDRRVNIHSMKERIHQLDSDVTKMRTQLESQSGDIYQLDIEQTRIVTRRDAIIQNLWDNYELSYIKALDYKHDFDHKAYNAKARALKSQIKKLGDVNLGAVAEYETISERYEFLNEQREDLITSSDQLQKLIRDIDRQMRQSFKVKLAEINDYFKETFSKLFGGGTGDIITTGEGDILDAEIVINAQPPGKKLQSLDLLSGGEKALTAISLLFAILKTKPSPFCILDEIEAALDDVNIYRFAEFLNEFVQNSQFIIITHRKGTMEIAEALYGVTMREQGVTTMLSVKLEDAESIVTS